MFRARLLSRRAFAAGVAAPRWALLVIPLVLAFCAVSVQMLMELRHDAHVRAMQGAENLLAALSQDIGRTVDLYDLSLRAVQDSVSGPDLLALSPALRKIVLLDRTANTRYLGPILVEDEHGRVIHDAASTQPRPGNFADREYFTAQRDHPDMGLFVSAPFRARTGSAGGKEGDWVIALSRRITRADGSFGGIVVGALRLSHFRQLFEHFKLGPHSVITLAREDGAILARTPWNDADMGRRITDPVLLAQFRGAPHGVFSGRSVAGGTRRTYSFTHIGTLPVILGVSLAQEDIYAAWRNQGLVVGATLVLLCLAGILLTGLLNRELGRRAGVERAIRESEAQYRLLAGNATDIIIRLDETLSRTYVSPACLPVLGYLPEVMLGGRVGDIVHPGDRGALIAAVEKAQRQAEAMEATYRLRHSDGHYVWTESRYSFVPEDRGFTVVLRDVSKRKEAELELEAATAELARLAAIDALTGLANRRLFDAQLEQEWRRAAREETPLSLLLLDVDNFKRFNDRYGHPAGDACLRQVAAAVGGTIHRPGDLAARYGGEELAVLLPGTDQFGAVVLAERLRAAIERLGIPHEGNPRCGGVVTASVGAATIVPAGQNTGDGTTLLAQADAALYEAKRAGRNRVMPTDDSATSSTPPSLPDEALRLETLAAYEAAGAMTGSDEFDQITRLAATLFDAPDAIINVLCEDEQVAVSAAGPLPPPRPRRDSFCAYTIAGRGALVVEDARADPRFRDSPLVASEAGIRFYAGAPLISPFNGQRLGALCVTDVHPRTAFNSGQISLLTRLAAVVAGIMERRRLELAAARTPSTSQPALSA